MTLSDELKDKVDEHAPDTPDLQVGHALERGTHADGSEDWQAARRKGIGGSDVATILGRQPYGTTRPQLWRQKTGREESKVGNAAVRFGSLIEPYLRQWLRDRAADTPAIYGDFEGLIDYPAQLRHPDYPWALGHVDGLIDGDEQVGVEIKNSSYAHGDSQYEWPHGVQEYHYPQMQHYLWVTGLDRWLYVYFEVPADREFMRLVADKHAADRDDYLMWVIDEGEVTTTEVERDYEFIDKMATAEARFWECVDNHEQPDEWLPDGEIRIEDPELEDLLDQYGRAHAAIKEASAPETAEAAKQEAKEAIKQRASAVAAERDEAPKKIWVNDDDYILWHGGYNDWQAKPDDRPPTLTGPGDGDNETDIDLGF